LDASSQKEEVMLIGLSGYARSGKDEAARGLVLLGFRRVAFADRLREILLALNPIVGFVNNVSAVRTKDVITEWGWESYKESPYGTEMRELMQRLGTECGRELISDSIWVDLALNGITPDENVVVTDVRFPNEFEAIKARGGRIIRIRRPGVVAANGHKSETALDGFPFDAMVNNDKSINILHDRVRRAVAL
jgi:hypothetical protein